MTLIGVTQRVCVDPIWGERRDCLDQRWTSFLEACGLTPVLLPNNQDQLSRVIDNCALEGFLLTGGDDPADIGGTTPERDIVEKTIINLHSEKPILGVCRGMQMLHLSSGGELVNVSGHSGTEHWVRGNFLGIESARLVNSFHHYGITSSTEHYSPTLLAADGLVEAMQHASRNIFGIMWHPERYDKPIASDINLFREIFCKCVH